jgi:hypothetical protein
MSDFVKIISTGLSALNIVQDNVEAALPSRSDLAEGTLLQDVSVSPGSSVDHRLGRQALGAMVVKQSDTANPILVTGLSGTSITVSGSFAANTTVSFWVF